MMIKWVIRFIALIIAYLIKINIPATPVTPPPDKLEISCNIADWKWKPSGIVEGIIKVKVTSNKSNLPIDKAQIKLESEKGYFYENRSSTLTGLTDKEGALSANWIFPAGSKLQKVRFSGSASKKDMTKGTCMCQFDPKTF